MVASQVPSISVLSDLTHLSIASTRLEFTTDSTRSWASNLTGLQSLNLKYCETQADALAAFTQLRALTLFDLETLSREEPLETLLQALTGLTLLTQLTYFLGYRLARTPGVDAFTALTASTNLHSLQLGVSGPGVALHEAPFRPGSLYPHLRLIDLQYLQSIFATPISEQQLCSSCPALEGADFNLCDDPSPTALLPLLQLSALTHLGVDRVGAAAASVACVAAQLTALKELVLEDLQQLTDPSLVQLTALTALQGLTLSGGDNASLELLDKVS